MPEPFSFAEVNATRLSYEMIGQGSPLVFIHGFGSDHRVWDFQVEVFAQSWCVIRYDIRGHGKSAFPTGEKYAHADDLAALLDYLSIPQAVVVGQSLGGEIAINFALRYPHRIRRLVLADTSLDGYIWSDEWYESWGLVYSTFAQSGKAASLPLLFGHPLFASGFKNPEVKRRLMTILSDYSGWHIVNPDPVIGNDPPAIECLDQIQVPTLILIGQHDLHDFHVISDLLLARIPHAQKIQLQDAGHVIPMEASAKFNEVVMEFLERGGG